MRPRRRSPGSRGRSGSGTARGSCPSGTALRSRGRPWPRGAFGGATCRVPLMSSGQRLRASCIVMVENPSAKRISKTLFLMAPKTRHPVDPVVLVEALVLGDDEGRSHVGRHLAQRHHGAPLEAEIGDQPAIGGIDLGGLVGIVAAQLVDGGTAVAGAGAGPRRDQHREAEREHREDRNEDVAPHAGSEPGADAFEGMPAGHAGILGGCGARFQRVTIGGYDRPPQDVAARGLVQDATPDLADRLRAGPLTAYVGFDPTADSLHVGSLVPVMGARLAPALWAHADRAGRRGHRNGRRSERQARRAPDARTGPDRPQRRRGSPASLPACWRSRGATPRGCGTTRTGSAASG